MRVRNKPEVVAPVVGFHDNGLLAPGREPFRGANRGEVVDSAYQEKLWFCRVFQSRRVRVHQELGAFLSGKKRVSLPVTRVSKKSWDWVVP
jgi:hypothetical protein|tara:strand:- start:132 stop:404 length:273 start_codon:yes stop_codon:yes gene_type:complete